MASNMDVSVSFLKYELASTIEQAVRSAVDSVLKETARVVGVKISAARSAAAESHRENQSLRERLETSESELKAVRYYMTAAEKNIKQCLLLNNQNQQPRSTVVRPQAQTEENLYLYSANSVGGNQLTTRDHPRSVRSFRNASGRTGFSRSLPSVGLCLPTPQSEWPRSTNRRRMRPSVALNQQSLSTHSQNTQQPQSEPSQMVTGHEEVGDGQFFISDDGVTNKEYRGNMLPTEDGGRIPAEQEAPVQTEDPSSDLSKFEFEVGGAAGNVNELGLIQVLEDHEEVRDGMIKVEDEHERRHADASRANPNADTAEALPMSPPSSSLTLPQVQGSSLGPGVSEASIPLHSTVQASRDGSDKIYRCNVCGRGFRRFYCLKTHQRIHTGERPYPCRYCDKRFRHLDSLHKHQRIHTGERPYRCAQCGCAFRELGQLKKHRLTHSPAPQAVNAGMHSQAPHSLMPNAHASYPWPHFGGPSMDS